jgi:hypothetical protein
MYFLKNILFFGQNVSAIQISGYKNTGPEGPVSLYAIIIQAASVK